MKRLFIIFILLILSAAPAFAADVLDRIVAVVNDEVVLQSELDRNLAPVFQEYQKRYQGEAFIQEMTKARNQILNQMIEDKLVLQEAKEKKIKISEMEVNNKVNEAQKRFRSPEDFQKYLDSQGLTLTRLKERYRDMLAIQKMQAMEVRMHVIISPLDAERFYKEHAAEFTVPEAFEVRSITIRKKSADSTDGRQAALAQEKLEGLRRRISSGAISFEEAAKQNSEDTYAAEGGDMGWMSRGQFIAKLEDEIFKLQPGKMTPVLDSDIGFHIFKMEGHRPEKTKTYEEARGEIENYLYAQKTQEKFQEWVVGLKKKAYISVR
jgi:peptidyl-prolyl cis-trans isomerase SurA